MPTIEDDPEEWEEYIANGSSAYHVESWLDPNQSKIKSLWQWPDPEEVPLQIAICGAAGTGKARLAKSLGNELDLPVINGIARNCKHIGFKLDKEAEWKDQFAIFLGQIWEQMEYDEFITAGTVIDVVAHVHYYAEKHGFTEDKVLTRAIANVANSIANNDYTVVFYLPPGRKPRNDGVRTTDKTYINEIDRLVRYYLDAFDIDYFPIKGTHAEKLDIARSYLEDFGLLFGR